jgi:4-carboxymuconolactone decarboxylase
MPPLPDDALSAEQQAAAAEITAGPRGGVVGPFVPLLRSPVLMTRIQKTGEYLRFESKLPRRLFEMIILLVARAWDQQFEWTYHRPIALQVGLEPAIVDAIAVDARPTGMDAMTEAAYDVITELHRTHFVSDATYRRGAAALGEAGLIDLVATVGYYTTLAMVMNVAQTPTAPDAGVLLPSRRPASTP